MRLLIVNPNTTVSMTERIGLAARAVAAQETEVVAVNPADGPASVEGYYDAAFSVPGLLEEIRKGEASGFDAYVIACFDDTGLEAARCLARGPVIGICEAACHIASLIATRFTVITTLPRSVPVLTQNLLKYGFDRYCPRVRAADVSVLELEDPASDARSRIEAEIEQAVEVDRVEAVVLGCAGMTELPPALEKRFGLPVIDGVGAAVKLAEAAHALGLATSKVGGYARPLAKAYHGAFAQHAPQVVGSE
ncbi:MAG: aspartate/glutamate racemase family protein [Kiloniellales bacterium]|nr:aspartate/glutamate racemase family protein [Kiloniellales bacterium]